ncbi:MAG: ECF-type sigma factor [Planctomycetota bacterium]
MHRGLARVRRGDTMCGRFSPKEDCLACRRANPPQLLNAAARGDARAAEQLLPLVYDQLHRIAERCLRREKDAHTLQPTVLVHDAFLNLVDQSSIDWQGRTRAALSARVIRRILIEHARARQAEKRGGARERVTLDEGMALAANQSFDLLDLDAALEKLAQLNERQAKVVELRFFGGLEVEAVAAALGVSERTVKGDWRVAKAWLRSQLERDVSDAG